MIVKTILPALVVLMLALPARAQDKGTLDPQPLPQLANPNDPKTPAKRLFAKGAKLGWPGLLVGDMSQPRGGPMITGHASHQVGLDADIWLTPMPKRELSRNEREDMSATMAVAPSRLDVD